MVDLFLILAIANFSLLPSFWFSLLLSFYGCPLYDTFHWYFCHFSLKMLPLFVCLLMLFKCSLSNIDRHFVTERLRNCEKCVLAKVIQWIRLSSDLLMFCLWQYLVRIAKKYLNQQSLCNIFGSVCKPNQWHTRWMVHPPSPPQFPYSINLSRTLPLSGPLHRNPLHWRWLFS